MESRRRFSVPGLPQRLWLWFEKLVNHLTASEYNPFYYIGAIGVFFLWIILVTGVYLFIFYSISAAGAYNSVEKLTVNQWYLGGVMRSLHRYAAQGLVAASIAHALRCYFLDRYKHWRWVAWVSGMIIIWLIWIGGIFGYLMVWDERAKLIAWLSSAMLESIPVFGMPLSITFARIQNVSDQIFYIILFIHFFSIVVIFVLMLVHLSRITKGIINPPRILAYALVFLLLLISAIKPAVSSHSANLRILTRAAPFDWLFMFIFPLLKFMSANELWLFIISVTLIISAAPWLTRAKRNPAVEVTHRNCTGCELCSEDCPYEAIQMMPRTDGMPYPLEAVIVSKRCASCGICMGACDYKALNLPDMSEEDIKNDIRRFSTDIKTSQQGPTVLVFVCAKGAWLGDGIGPEGVMKGFEWARFVTLQCIGMLQPSMIAIPFENKVDGVLIAGCRSCDCSFRKGNDWIMGRIGGYRAPIVKRHIDKSRINTVWLSAVEKNAFLSELNRFRAYLKGHTAS